MSINEANNEGEGGGEEKAGGEQGESRLGCERVREGEE